MASEERAMTVRDAAPQSLQEVMTLGKIFAASGFFKDITSEAKAVVQIMAGREYGFGPFASLTGIHIIQGKPTLSAHLMATAIKRSGKYNYRIKHLDDKGCTIVFTENGEIVGESTFAEEDAKKAGLLGKEGNMWGKYPRNMYFARALSNGAKFYCPDIFEAGAYVEGEIPEAETVRPRVVDISQAQEQKTPEQTLAEAFDDAPQGQGNANGEITAEVNAILALREQTPITPKNFQARCKTDYGESDLFKLTAEQRAEVKGRLEKVIKEAEKTA